MQLTKMWLCYNTVNCIQNIQNIYIDGLVQERRNSNNITCKGSAWGELKLWSML